MIASRPARNGEQLKFNLNAVVDNINLINVGHEPEPIRINKKFVNTNNFSHVNPDRNVNMKPSFEYIDEEKLLMYSFLARRDLKTKEWLTSQSTSDTLPKQIQPVRLTKKVEEAKKPVAIKKTSFSSTNSTVRSASSAVAEVLKPIQNHSDKKTEVNEIQKCCDESIRSIEHLHKQLQTYKYDRLKVVFNDPQEEEKQKRIQLEQIKYLSRSMYNHQNQLSRFKVLFSKEIAPDQQKKNLANSVLKRIIHTMGLVVKTVQVFADSYPYRPDEGEITEKLCVHFFKQLQSSMQNFSECIIHLDDSEVTVNKVRSLLEDCQQDLAEVTNEKTVKQPMKSSDLSRDKISNTKPKQVVKMVRGQKNAEKNLIKKKTELSVVQKARQKILRENVQKVFEKNVEKIKMYPASKDSSKTNIPRSKSEEKIQTILYPRPCFENDNQNIDNSLSMHDLSVNSIKSPAFKQMSSATLSSARKQNDSFRSRSAEKLVGYRSRSAEKSPKRHEIISFLKKPDSRQIYEMKPILHTVQRSRSASPDKRSISPFKRNSSSYSPNHILTRLDSIKRESDLIRKKYANLNYASGFINSSDRGNQRRPYEECYIVDEEVIPRDYEPDKLSYEDSLLKLNRPTEAQLKRTLEYAKNFADYSKNSSVTEIGESKFDDFQLFEYLSEELYGELLDSVYEEIENINEELTTNLIDNEFKTELPYNVKHLESVSSNSTVFE